MNLLSPIETTYRIFKKQMDLLCMVTPRFESNRSSLRGELIRTLTQESLFNYSNFAQ